MEEKPPPRKMKFAPKGPPPKRAPKPTVKQEPAEIDNNSSQAMDLLRRINEGSLRTKPKVEKKSSASQVAWMGGVANSTRSYSYQNRQSSSSRAGFSGPGGEDEEDYKEPWDYNSYYPITLPTRRPYSGNPERLDEEEFAQNSENAMRHHEDSINAASDLGITEDMVEPRKIFVQLPSFPMAKGTNRGTGASSLKDLPAGLVGKMQVFKSGAIKFKIGDILYDLNPGAACDCVQDYMAVRAGDELCSHVEELNTTGVLTPDVDSLLDSLGDL